MLTKKEFRSPKTTKVNSWGKNERDKVCKSVFDLQIFLRGILNENILAISVIN